MNFIDTHCHIHSLDYSLDPDEVITGASELGVSKLICVGCTLEDSKLAVNFAARYDNIWASVGIHPHEAKDYVDQPELLQAFRDLAGKDRVVAIGEIGLDYYYQHSAKQDQKDLLRFQLSVAQEHNLPVIFHVREAYQDFWEIYDEFKPKGIIHSFSAGHKELQQILSRGLLVGLNGITTFMKPDQLEVIKSIPPDSLVLETDAPYLTPVPFRGTICQPKHVVVTAEFLSTLFDQTLEELAARTTNNATRLLSI